MKTFVTNAYTVEGIATLKKICSRMGWEYKVSGDEISVTYPASEEDMVQWIVVC